MLVLEVPLPKPSDLKAKEPITLTLWHNYGGQMKNTMDEMIDEFNESIGAEQGVIINVTHIKLPPYMKS